MHRRVNNTAHLDRKLRHLSVIFFLYTITYYLLYASNKVHTLDLLQLHPFLSKIVPDFFKFYFSKFYATSSVLQTCLCSFEDPVLIDFLRFMRKVLMEVICLKRYLLNLCVWIRFLLSHIKPKTTLNTCVLNAI